MPDEKKPSLPVTFPCHGTYPFQTQGVWDVVQRRVPVNQVAALLGIPDKFRHDPGPCPVCRGARGPRTCDECFGTNRAHEYLWLNKGYIVRDLFNLNHDAAAAWGAGLEGIKAGMRAFYLADGVYMLIKRVAPGPGDKEKPDGDQPR